MKKTLIYRLIPAICFSFILISCEKTITDVNIPDRGRKIVLNSIIHQDSLIRIYLQKSKHAMDDDNGYESITDAIINIYKNNELIETITKINPNTDANNDQGFVLPYYVSNTTTAKAGDKLKIEAIVPNLTSVTTTTTIPQPVHIESLDTATAKKSFYDEFADPNSELECIMVFNDPAKQKNYYLLTVNKRTSFKKYDPQNPEMMSDEIIEYDDPMTIYSNEIGINDDSWTVGGLIFSDDLFDGETKKIRFGFDKWHLYSLETKSIGFSLNSISKEYYLYLKSYSKYYDAQDFGPFAESVNVYNNIINGFGILGSLSTSSVVFDLIRAEKKDDK